MKYHIITYGCQMNKSDSERIAGILEKIGCFSASQKEKADLVIINACSVRQSAIHRVFGQIKNLRLQNKKLKIFLTGCLLNKDKKRLKEKVDLIFDIKNLPKLPKFLAKSQSKQNNNYFKINPKYQSQFTAYVPIMTGCNNFCSYCVVPYLRGIERSRPIKEILNEVENLIKKGYKEIILLGQNVNSYQSIDRNLSSGLSAGVLTNGNKIINFPKLLKIINNLKGDFWLNFMTSHPKDLSDDLIKIMAQSKKITPYLHLPIQSGNNQILKKMNRKYTVDHYKNLIKKIRQKIPNVSISTDIIVGFPGETKKQFQDTAKLMKKIKFDMAYIAKYSPRDQTAASKFKDNVSLKEKKERWEILTEILRKTALENNKKIIGKTLNVLVEKNNFGHTNTFKKVKFLNNKKIIGKFFKIKIKKALSWGLSE